MRKQILILTLALSCAGTLKAETEFEQHMREMREDMAERRKEVQADVEAARQYYLKREWLTAVAKDLDTHRSESNDNASFTITAGKK
jgi:hypothetical protein